MFEEATRSRWNWQGHEIEVLSAGCKGGIPAILVHGFGCSTSYFRRTVDALAAQGQYEVLAFDLLGQGLSDKPSTVEYSIAFWASLLDDFAREYAPQGGAVLIGNSIGSLIALSASAGVLHANDSVEPTSSNRPPFLSEAGRVKGVVMFNCAGGLNIRVGRHVVRVKKCLTVRHVSMFVLPFFHTVWLCNCLLLL
jgi:pimeloyl-ACP methyl ester carboxylesterase